MTIDEFGDAVGDAVIEASKAPALQPQVVAINLIVPALMVAKRAGASRMDVQKMIQDAFTVVFASDEDREAFTVCFSAKEN